MSAAPAAQPLSGSKRTHAQAVEQEGTQDDGQLSNKRQASAAAPNSNTGAAASAPKGAFAADKDKHVSSVAPQEASLSQLRKQFDDAEAELELAKPRFCVARDQLARKTLEECAKDAAHFVEDGFLTNAFERKWGRHLDDLAAFYSDVPDTFDEDDVIRALVEVGIIDKPESDGEHVAYYDSYLVGHEAFAFIAYAIVFTTAEVAAAKALLQ